LSGLHNKPTGGTERVMADLRTHGAGQVSNAYSANGHITDVASRHPPAT
jgi:hypothetical protein